MGFASLHPSYGADGGEPGDDTEMKYAMTVRRIVREPSSSSSRRRPGPITTEGDCCATLGPEPSSTTRPWGYGSLLSQGRRSGCKTHHTFGVVLAKARTHYPKSQLVRDAGAAITLITECRGYGSWLSPGRRMERALRTRPALSSRNIPHDSFLRLRARNCSSASSRVIASRWSRTSNLWRWASLASSVAAAAISTRASSGPPSPPGSSPSGRRRPDGLGFRPPPVLLKRPNPIPTLYIKGYAVSGRNSRTHFSTLGIETPQLGPCLQYLAI
ncbi:hypothetical protein ACVIGB_002165 [Bradyrhizobium sp. USDA 4341]